MVTATRVWVLALAGITCFSLGCAARRPPMSESELLAQRARCEAQLQATRTGAFDDLIERLKRKTADYRAGRTSTPPTLDVLVLSGGGDYGAFGAGFLKGWGRVQQPQESRRPEFDVVLGVSTGALIAPFAFLGTDADYERIDTLYRDPKPDWVKDRGLLFFLPANVSFAEVPGLERDLRAAVDREAIARIADPANRGRLLAVNATNIDDGSQWPFDMGVACRSAIQTGDIDRVHQMLLASAGIPGAFPPREVDGMYFVDGGVTANIIYGGALKAEQSFPAAWKRMVPDMPVPPMRYWVIVNNQLRSPPTVVQPSWMPVITRSVEIAIRSSTVTSIRDLMALVELMRVRDGVDVEVHLISIPDDWRAPKPGVFQKETMEDLAKLGERLGSDPESWTSECP